MQQNNPFLKNAVTGEEKMDCLQEYGVKHSWEKLNEPLTKKITWSSQLPDLTLIENLWNRLNFLFMKRIPKICVSLS